MKFNFRRITALAMSALTLGMTMGVAAAANYPAPFVQGGAANVAVVYGTGTGVSALDLVQAGNLQSNLQSFMTGTTGGTSVSTSGETASLDTSTTRIWLNTSLNTAKSTLTKADLPTTLADTTFSGDSSATLTQTISLVSGAAAGTANSGKVIFAKQPSSSDDPVIGLSLGSSETSYPLYNASVSFSHAINFTNTDSQGQVITLFGKDYTVSSDSSIANGIVLFQSAKSLTLTQGGTSGSDSATVTVDGTDHSVTLLNADSSSATISVDGTSQSINVGSSKKINGVDIAITSSQTSTAGGNTAVVLVGAKKLSFLSGTTVTSGDNNDPVDGTYVYLTGGATATTKITVAVFRPDSSNDAITPGQSFTDPVFGSFKLDYAGLSSPLDDSSRETISVKPSGDDAMSLTMTDSKSNTKTFDFAYNHSGNWNLSDSSGNSIYPYEMANLSQDDYVMIGNADYGHLLQVTRIYNNTGTTHSNDKVTFQDVLSGATYDTVFTSTEGSGTLTVDGKQYTVTFGSSGDTGWTQVKYPTTDSQANTGFVLFPTIQTQNGAKLALYEPLSSMSLATFNGSSVKTGSEKFYLPNGDGYTSVTATYTGGNGTAANWTIGSTTDVVSGPNRAGYTTLANVTVGKLKYRFTASATINKTTIQLLQPNTNTVINEPAVVVLEGKDDNNAYNAAIIDTEQTPAGDSANGVGVNTVYFTSSNYNSGFITLQSNSDMSEAVDWYGTLAKLDAGDSDQKIATLSIPKTQVYNSLYMGSAGSSVSSTSTGSSGATQLGDVLVKDSEVSSVSSKNLIVVGGSCINSVAAGLVGGAYCGSAFTDATGVGSGQYLIKSYTSPYASDKIALLVAGYEAADTVNAATYLRTQTVDTSKSYIGTTSTSATVQTTSA